jgi:hypothetical protein
MHVWSLYDGIGFLVCGDPPRTNEMPMQRLARRQMSRFVSPTPFRMQEVLCPGGDFWLPDSNVHLVLVWWYQHIPCAEAILVPVKCQCKGSFAGKWAT